MDKIMEKYKRPKMSRSSQILKTTLSFVTGFGLGFLLSWIGAVLITTVPRYRLLERDSLIGNPSQYSEEFVVFENDLSKYSRILCYFLVDFPTHKNAIHVRDTWAQRCDKTIFFSTKTDPKLDTVVLNVTPGYKYLWEKGQAAVKYLYQNHKDEYDWFLKADDDTYIIVENLRYFLQLQNSEEPIYFGVKFKQHVNQGYMSGGGGYVLSREALTRLVKTSFKINNQTLCPNKARTGAEDLNIGKCLESVGVKAGESLDRDGKPRFFSHSPVSLLYKMPLINHLHWYWKYIWHKHTIGPECCSPDLISFHNVDPRMMWTLEFLLYRMRIHKDLQPSNRNHSTSTTIPPNVISSSKLVVDLPNNSQSSSSSSLSNLIIKSKPSSPQINSVLDKSILINKIKFKK